MEVELLGIHFVRAFPHWIGVAYLKKEEDFLILFSMSLVRRRCKKNLEKRLKEIWDVTEEEILHAYYTKLVQRHPY